MDGVVENKMRGECQKGDDDDDDFPSNYITKSGVCVERKAEKLHSFIVTVSLGFLASHPIGGLLSGFPIIK